MCSCQQVWTSSWAQNNINKRKHYAITEVCVCVKLVPCMLLIKYQVKRNLQRKVRIHLRPAITECDSDVHWLCMDLSAADHWSYLTARGGSQWGLYYTSGHTHTHTYSSDHQASSQWYFPKKERKIAPCSHFSSLCCSCTAKFRFCRISQSSYECD